MYGYIYLITNNINGKKYIGQHKSSNFDDGYMGSGAILKKAQKKEGIEHFSKTLLVWCDDKDSLNKAEIEWINKYNACHNKEFYNVAEGGNVGNKLEGKTEEEMLDIKNRKSESMKGKNVGKNSFKNKTKEEMDIIRAHMRESSAHKNSWENKSDEEIREIKEKISKANSGRKMSDEFKEKVSKAMSGENNPMFGKGYKLMGEKNGRYGKPMSDEAKKKSSEALKKNWANKSEEEKEAFRKKCSKRMSEEGSPMRGKKHTEEAKKKMSEARKEANINRHWFNNGVKNVFVEERPEGFVLGRINNRKWYNNGIKNIFAEECPTGFVPGRLKKSR